MTENRQQVINRIQTDIQNELPTLNPFLRASITHALTVGLGGRIFDVYKQLEQIQDELFVNTATQEIFIARNGLLKGISRNAASPATGFITITGNVGGIIDNGTIFASQDATEYEVINGPYTISANTTNIDTLTRVGTTATAQTVTKHLYATENNVLINGADQVEYNGTFPITAIGEKLFTYQITGSPVTPATGTITSQLISTKAEVQSVETGINKNLDSGAKLTLKTPIINVDDDAYVQFSKISGGEDLETIESYKARVLNAYANPISNFNDSNIIQLAQTIAGVIRVWVFDATPEAGEVEIYFTRDNDTDIIPDPTEVQIVKDIILTIKPTPMRDQDVHVYAPTPITVDFVFTNLVPDSNNMRNAISENLKQFFKDDTNVSENVAEDGYRSTIYQTINPETGEFVQSFTLSSPIGDIAINHGELAVIGNINWNI